MDKEKELIYLSGIDKYIQFKRDKRMSKAHIYMIWRCINWLENSKYFRNNGGSYVSMTVIKDFKVDNLYPDIYTPLFDVEVETGLKKSYTDLKERILRNPKTVIVVLPNDETLERYVKNCSVRKTHLFFCTFETFPEMVKRAIRPYYNKKHKK